MLSQRIRTLRKKRGYSQEQLARKLNLTQGAVSQWENGLTIPAADQIVALSNVFGITIDELMKNQKVVGSNPAGLIAKPRILNGLRGFALLKMYAGICSNRL